MDLPEASLNTRLDRRNFNRLLAGSALSAGFAYAAAKTQAIDDTLRDGIARRHIPAAAGMAATGSRTIYQGAFGTRDSSGGPVRTDSIFAIASMTKAVTTVAALQLVEQGKITLDEPVSKVLPKLAKPEALDHFDGGGKPVMRPARTAITLRHLLTHTSGLCYDTWDPDMFRYRTAVPDGPAPLMFEPGARWQYGTGVDEAGRLVEAISGMTLEDYFQAKIFRPLGMPDTSYLLPEAKFDRLVSSHTRNKTGELEQAPRKLPALPKSFSGGGGLYSTAADYVRFMQAILGKGRGVNKARILEEKTVASMGTNQIGGLTAGKMMSFRPEISSDVDIQPGFPEKWGLGFLINTTGYAGGRSAGSLAWAGLFNTFYWIDPKRDLCAVLLMQFLPFVDREATGLLSEFERAVYASL